MTRQVKELAARAEGPILSLETHKEGETTQANASLTSTCLLGNTHSLPQTE